MPPFKRLLARTWARARCLLPPTPFIQDIAWTPGLGPKTAPGTDSQKVSSTIGNAITVGAGMGGASLQEAAGSRVD